ncbi:MAG: carboxypeptidase-like regulatory domain-containing protein [Hymenobacter sp.]|nr:MAG: carboxypeptidase-like regulatory domain-containing protein [Hymenobacter sp.]
MRFLLLVTAAWLLTLSAFAQSAVRGKVLDGKDQSPLIGANAVLIHLPDSVRTGTAVGPDGGFEISGVAPGRYVFVASYIGYQDQRQPLTVPTGGTPVTLGTVASGLVLKAFALRLVVSPRCTTCTCSPVTTTVLRAMPPVWSATVPSVTGVPPVGTVSGWRWSW